MGQFSSTQIKLSLAVQLGLTFGAATFLLTLIFGWTTGKLAQQQLESNVGHELAHLSQSLTYTIDRSIFERYREIQILARLEPFRNAQTTIVEQQTLLNTLQSTYPGYSWIGFASSDGTVRASTRGLLQGQNVAKRPWFPGARKAPYVGDVHEALLLSRLLPNPTREPLRFIDISVPVTDIQGQFHGVLGAHLNWNWAVALEAKLRDTPIAREKEIFVLAKDGTVLLGPPTWQGKHLKLNSVELAQSGQTGYRIEYWGDHEAYLTSFSQSKGYLNYPGLGWIVLVRQKAEIAFAPIQELHEQILWNGLLLSIGFAIVGGLAANRITRPILKIAALADQIRQGDRNIAIPATPYQPETDQLSQALNQLIRELIEREYELETQLAYRQQMAESLYRSEEQLRQIVNNIEDALLLKEIDTGKVIYHNAGYAELHSNAVIPFDDDPQRWVNCLHPDDRERVVKELQSQIAGESFFNDEYRVVKADGTIRWIWDRSFPIRDETGRIYRYAVIKRDITDRKHSEEIFKMLLESTASVTGQNFFSTMVQNLATALEVEHIFIAERLANGTLQTLAFWSQGCLQSNITYNPDITPCRLILAEGSYYCCSDVAQQFPYNAFLVGIQAKGYFGVALKNAAGEALGTICAISNKPLDNRSRYATILHIFAVRAAAELERQHTEMMLRESEERFRLLAENTRDLICLHELNGQFLYISPSCHRMLGFEPNELIGKNPLMLLHPDDQNIVSLQVDQMIRQGQESPITYRIRRKTGEYIWLESFLKTITFDHSEQVYLQTSSRNITDKIKIQEQLQYDAVHDGLTGLPNRSLLLERLNLALERAKRHPDFSFAVLFVDLDRFKVINDSLGHLAGDQLLLIVAEKLKETIRSIDLVARLGGDEFILLLEEISSLQEVLKVGDRILESLRSPIQLETHQVVMNASIGIVMGTNAYRNSSDLLRDADTAMYSAKARGKACYAVFNSTMHVQALRQLELENDLRQAIEHQEFTLVYQPIISLASGQLSGFEALVRWQHPLKGIVSPVEFIPIAEETGLIVPLGKWILREACHQMAMWRLQFPSAALLKVSVNLSVKQLKELDLVTQIKQVLQDTGLPGHCLALEITESMLMEDTETISQLLEQLRACNIQISIDDFGTGFSSLSYLHRLPVNNLKIDRSFISNLLDSPRNLNVTKTIIALTDELGINAIAEGIESQEQLQQLRKFGCEMGQGYLFKAPVTAEIAQNLI